MGSVLTGPQSSLQETRLSKFREEPAIKTEAYDAHLASYNFPKWILALVAWWLERVLQECVEFACLSPGFFQGSLVLPLSLMTCDCCLKINCSVCVCALWYVINWNPVQGVTLSCAASLSRIRVENGMIGMHDWIKYLSFLIYHTFWLKRYVTPFYLEYHFLL